MSPTDSYRQYKVNAVLRQAGGWGGWRWAHKFQDLTAL